VLHLLQGRFFVARHELFVALLVCALVAVLGNVAALGSRLLLHLGLSARLVDRLNIFRHSRDCFRRGHLVAVIAPSRGDRRLLILFRCAFGLARS